MRINLSEIPPEGRQYLCNQKTGEFEEALTDLVGQRPYDVNFFIQPVGNIYEITGKIDTHLGLTCARCANDFNYGIHEKIHELLVPGGKLPRTGKEAKVNHVSELDDSGPSTTVIESLNFDMDPLVRDLVALAEPNIAICSDHCKGLCQFCGTNLNLKECQCEAGQQKKSSPFAKLGEIKFN